MIRILTFLLAIASLWSQAQSEKTFRISKKYLNIPIQSSVERQRIIFNLENEYYTHNDIRVSQGEVDYWTFIDVSEHLGKDFTFEFSENVSGIDMIYQSEKFAGQDSLYEEYLRPQIHYTTRRGWNNDPNGMVFYDGEYHLFYQHNPYEVNWGNMTWGHAVSKNLLNWEELPITLLPDQLGTMYSGSAVVDYKNTSGFNKDNTPALVAMYTAAMQDYGEADKQQQCIAYSLDNGRTLTKYSGNPVIPSERKFGSGHERDPKVFWYEPGNHWVMIMNEGINFCIYNSNNLKDWDHVSTIKSGFWECPELFELPVDGDLNNKKWVVYGVQGIYMIGDFNGKTFTPETEMLRYNLPGGMTAAQTFNDAPDGRRIQIGWGHAVFPGMPFGQTFTFPQEHRLKSTAKGIQLFIEPIIEIENLYVKSYRFSNEYIGENLNTKLEGINHPLLHVKAKLKIENGRQFGLNVNGYRIIYNVADNTLNDVFLPLKNQYLDLELIVDKTIVEVYVNKGLFYWFANYNDEDPTNFKISLEASANKLNVNPKTLIESLEIHELKSIWNN